MSATLRLTCTYGAPETLKWAADLNKAAHHPFATVDGQEIQLDWNKATDIPLVAGRSNRVQVYIRLIGLHWCGADAQTEPARDGEVQCYEYRLELKDRLVNRGALVRTS